jgi:hypothetical protein
LFSAFKGCPISDKAVPYAEALRCIALIGDLKKSGGTNFRVLAGGAEAGGTDTVLAMAFLNRLYIGHQEKLAALLRSALPRGQPSASDQKHHVNFPWEPLRSSNGIPLQLGAKKGEFCKPFPLQAACI